MKTAMHELKYFDYAHYEIYKKWIKTIHIFRVYDDCL